MLVKMLATPKCSPTGARSTQHVRIMSIAVDRTKGKGLDTVREHSSLHFEPVDALVSAVQHVLVPAGPANGI